MADIKRIIVGGEGRVGIIELLRKFKNISISLGLPSRVGFDYYSKNFQIDDKSYKLSIWEFTKKDYWKSLLEPFIKGAHGAILVFELIQTNLLGYLRNWVKFFRKYNSNLPIIFVGTKPDITNMTGVNEKRILDLNKELKIFDNIKVCTIKGHNLELIFEKLLTEIYRCEEEAGNLNEKEGGEKISEKISKRVIQKLFENKKKVVNEFNEVSFKINEYFSLKLENKSSVIYVNNKKFILCKYLLLVNPHKNEKQKEIDSIDESSEILSSKLEGKQNQQDYGLTYEQEFWGHCSNLQVWYEHGYDTRLLHRNLAFPLLKELTKAGDFLAKRVFKGEIAERISCGYIPVIIYLIENDYLDYLSVEEFQCVMEDLKSNMDEGIYWFIFGMVYMKKLEFEKAKVAFERVMERNNNNPEFWRLFGKIFCQIGEIYKSIECFDKSIKLDPDNTAALVDIGFTFWSNRIAKMYDKGIEYCELATKKDPKKAGAWYMKAENLKAAKKYKEAIENFEKTIEIRPDVAYVWQSMGMAYKNLRNYIKAMTCFVKSTELSEDWDYEKDAMKELKSCHSLELHKKPLNMEFRY